VCSATLFHVPAVQFMLTVMNIFNVDALLFPSNVTLLTSVIQTG